MAEEPTHAPSRAPHTLAHGGCLQRKNQCVEARGWLVGVGVLSRGRSGDSAPDAGVTCRS